MTAPEPTLTAVEFCWRHDFEHREYVCRCDPPRDDDSGRDETGGDA